ncbi:MAG: MinD/ParA family protein [Lachnospiraceae bacterium]|nr:MinD/ParA family protein [Lachnospiraceae bacterium]
MDQAEQLRNIVKLHNQAEPKVARVITVTSGKGGVGKSNMSVNLALQLKKMGKRVIIFDADFGLANIEVLFGAFPPYNLGDVIYKDKNIKEVITTGPLDIGFISGGTGIEGLGNLGKEEVQRLVSNLAELDSLADVIIVDTGAGISDSVLEFVLSGNEVILVTTPEPTSITDSYSLLKALNRSPGFSTSGIRIRIAVNRVLSASDGRNLFSKLDVVVNRFLDMEIEYLGNVPQDDHILRAVMKQNPVSIEYPNSKSAKAFEEIAKKIISDAGEGEPNASKKGMAGLFSNFMSKRRFR